MSKPTLDQRRAKHAWQSVTSLRDRERDGKYGDNAKEYAREAKKLPMRIMTAGLGPALAFILAKAKNKRQNIKKIHEHITDWVINGYPIEAKKKGSLMESILDGDSCFLRRATDETLAYLQWLNRFAEAEGLTDDEGERE